MPTFHSLSLKGYARLCIRHQGYSEDKTGKHRLAVKELPTVSLLSLLHLGTHPLASCVLINLYVTNLCAGLFHNLEIGESLDSTVPLVSLDSRVPEGSELSM